MRSPVDAFGRIVALGLTAALAGCGVFGGGDRPAGLAANPDSVPAMARSGPAADYPIVVGEPFTVDGELYTPADTLNYDAVGYATLDPQGGAGVTVAHKTLPLPSYVELTSLDSGKTILARVERRGPMSGARLVALSPGAQAQLDVAEGAPVRMRRVNPPEADRAELRAGRTAPERMEMPKSLADVLRRKLPGQGSANLRSAASAPPPPALPARRPAPAARSADASSSPGPAPAVRPRVAARAPIAAPATDVVMPQTLPAPRGVTAYPLPPLAGAPRTAAQTSTPVRVTPLAPQREAPREVTGDGFVIQAAAFSSKANAQRAAKSLGGFVTPAGRFFRVRTGPYSTRGQAEAALAKVRAAGYSDARVFTAG